MRILESVRSGLGHYRLREAALYARLPHKTLQKWVHGDATHVPVRARKTGVPGETRFLSFHEFIEAVAIRHLRVQCDVSLRKIREAINEAKNAYGIDHPFANKGHRTVVDNSGDIHIIFPGRYPVGLTGADKKQHSLKPVLELFMRDIEFDENQMAFRYVVHREEDVRIVMNPRQSFGEPFVEGVGYSAETLWRAAVTEGSIEQAAEHYEVDPRIVTIATRYWNDINGVAA